MTNRRLLAISSLFLAATVSAGVAGRAANTEVDSGTAFSRLKALVGDWDVESTQGKRVNLLLLCCSHQSQQRFKSRI